MHKDKNQPAAKHQNNQAGEGSTTPRQAKQGAAIDLGRDAGKSLRGDMIVQGMNRMMRGKSR